jgi:hypothetical protein
VKLRVIGRQQQLLRVDFESQPSRRCWLEQLGAFERLLPEYDVVVLSDYGKGGLAHIAQMIARRARAGKPCWSTRRATTTRATAARRWSRRTAPSWSARSSGAGATRPTSPPRAGAARSSSSSTRCY